MRVTGDKELVIALKALGKGLPSSAIDRSMKSAAKPMLDEAIQRARQHRQPHSPPGGHIDENIKFLRKRQSTAKNRNYNIGATGKRKSILTWLEYGTAAHFQPRRFGGIWHPGARQFPILRPSFDSHDEQTIQRFGREIWTHVAAIAARLPKGRK